jgi:peptidoglycan/xylan/chitin deacetylase (PgdA/CDA1 family)
MSDASYTWPGGKTAALVVNIMFEQWAPGVAPGLGPMGNPLPAGALDYQAVSWADYGWRTGVWSALELLERESVPATFYVSGILTETAPKAIVAIAESGHELSGHSWSQDRIPARIEREEERDEIIRCTEAITAVSGQRPRGWISPRCTPSASTPELLAEAGYEWWGDVFDTDLPYWLDTAHGRITALPFGLEINDLPMTVRYGQPTREIASSFIYEAQGLSVSKRLGHIDVTLHAHIGCRPAGLQALSEIIAKARSLGMFIGTRGALADQFADAN